MVMHHFCTTKHNHNRLQHVRWMKVVWLQSCQLTTLARNLMSQLTYHGKYKIGLWKIFCSKSPVEHVPTVWTSCGTLYFNDHLQENGNANKKIFKG
jgi:hypothetical protein